MPQHHCSRLADRDIRPGRPSVLLVDDEDSVRAAMRRYFVRQGWDVREAGDGASAQSLLDPKAANAFDLVICDLRMPQYSGCDLYRWVALHRPETAARFVFVSGDLQSPKSAAFLTEVQRPVLPKPFELDELTRIVDEVAGSARAA